MTIIEKITCFILLVMVIVSPATAQFGNDSQKQLTKKSIKQARKDAKRYTKNGYYVAPGALPIDKQLENAWEKQNETDEKGSPKYIVESGNAIAETRTAAKWEADEMAKLTIAGSINTKMDALIESNISNLQLTTEDAISVTKLIASSRSLIVQELGRTIPLSELYRDIGKNVEADIRLAYDYQNAMGKTRKLLRKKLEEETKLSKDQLDEILKF